MASCPLCYSDHVIKNGHIHNGKQRFKCCDCGRKFIENSTKITISQQTKSLIDQPKAAALSDRLLLERISLAGIARVTQVSQKWLQNYVNQKYAQIPRQVKVTVKKKEN